MHVRSKTVKKGGVPRPRRLSLALDGHAQNGVVLVDGLVDVLLLVGVADQLHHLLGGAGGGWPAWTAPIFFMF